MELNFVEINQTLRQYDLEIDAAYFHGLLAGLICAGIEDGDIDDWLPALFYQRFVSQTDYQDLSNSVLSAYYSIRSELDQDGFGFTIVLPDDLYPLDFRVEMMGSWCRGYLVALIEYAQTVVESLPDDCAEFVSDVEQIVDMEVGEDESEESLDESFMTLEEHLRVGVQLVYENMNPLQPS